jgi:hypothetical protein
VTSGEPPESSLEESAARLERVFPGLHVRFARVMGRRVSHLAGSASDLPGDQVALEVAPGLVAILSGALPERIDDILSLIRGNGSPPGD